MQSLPSWCFQSSRGDSKQCDKCHTCKILRVPRALELRSHVVLGEPGMRANGLLAEGAELSLTRSKDEQVNEGRG